MNILFFFSLSPLAALYFSIGRYKAAIVTIILSLVIGLALKARSKNRD
jgi:tetrahydromethanopterin S-methyltransferase subunit C